jgi:hypothetical protein
MKEKKAFFDPLTLAIGGGLHVGANIGQKILRRTNVGKRMEQSQFASGLAHSLQGKKLHPATENVMRYGLGPESLAHYEAGHAVGKQLAGLSPDKRAAALRQMGSALGESSHMVGAPMFRSMPGGIERFLKGQPGWMERNLTAVPATGETPLHQRLIAPALGVAAVAAAPHTAPQFIVNALRDRILKSRVGRSFAIKELAQGARGKTVSPLRRGLTDLFLSPAANDPRDIGLAANKEYGDIQRKVNEMAAARGHGPVPLPGAEQIADFAENVHARLNKKPSASAIPAAPIPKDTGSGLTNALLAGGGLYALHNRLQDDEARG